MRKKNKKKAGDGEMWRHTGVAAEGVIAAVCRPIRRFLSCLRAAVASSLRLFYLSPWCVSLSSVLRAALCTRCDAFSAQKIIRTHYSLLFYVCFHHLPSRSDCKEQEEAEMSVVGGVCGRKLRERKEEPRENRAPPSYMLLISGTRAGCGPVGGPSWDVKIEIWQLGDCS